MFSKSLFTFLIIISGISFFSCNSPEKDKNAIPEDSQLAPAVDSFALYEEKLAKDSLNFELRNKIAVNYYAAKDYQKAIFHFLKVYHNDGKNLAVIINLGNLYYDTELYEKAIEFYKKALLLDNTNTSVRCDMATCYLNIKEPKTALALLKENIKQDFNHLQSHHNLSVVYTELGMTKEAEEELAIFNKLSSQK